MHCPDKPQVVSLLAKSFDRNYKYMLVGLDLFSLGRLTAGVTRKMPNENDWGLRSLAAPGRRLPPRHPQAFPLSHRSIEHGYGLIKMPSNKSFRIKRALAKAQRQNRPLPQWFRLKTDSKITYNAKRRNWRRTKLNL
ncbi:hypothetical protein O181_006388 [Austropuccinia psidii MF-1]|uniref:Large ribosomal subunit protein eL39 n=1 Tax=Austropuccinia psidii MF-1 TaxID=1389203 RepID=A0A9Q3GGJ3_9BASI|nr:hypothetical protein [Austropuccinia psidii MF-1]